MMLFLLPAERRNKIRVKKGKFFDECVGSVSADASVGSDSLPLPYFWYADHSFIELLHSHVCSCLICLYLHVIDSAKI